MGRNKYLLMISFLIVANIRSSALSGERLEIKSLVVEESSYSQDQDVRITIKNHSEEWCENVTVWLDVYDKDKELIADSGQGSKREQDGKFIKRSIIQGPNIYWHSRGQGTVIHDGYMQAKEGDKTNRFPIFKIKGRSQADIYFRLRPDFEDVYGKPKYYKVKLKVNDKLVDVLTKPKSFLKEIEKIERE